MDRKRKFGASLILIGIGIPLILFFFQKDDTILTINITESISRKLTEEEIKILGKISTYKKLQQILERKIWVKAEDVILPESFKEWQLRESKKKDGFIPISVSDVIKEIESIYGKDNFEKEKWNVRIVKHINIPYRRMLGLGVLLIFIGLSILIFSYFH